MALIQKNDDDGSLTIDFGQYGPIVVAPPTFGQMKRLRAERDKLVLDGARRIAELKKPEPVPVPDDVEETDEQRQAAAIDLATRRRAYNAETEQINLDVAIQWWRLLLIGDGTFRGLASPPPPEDVDEWPAGLLYDMKAVPRNDDGEIDLQKFDPTTILDKVFLHWGKDR